MTKHLDEHEISDAVAGLELGAVSADHLESCLSCRQRVSEMRDLIDARRRELEADAPDWDRQRRGIFLRLPAGPAGHSARRRPWTRTLLAVAAVLVAAIGIRAFRQPAPPVEAGSDSELPVEQILADVEALLADDSVPGFERIDPGLEEELYENGAS